MPIYTVTEEEIITTEYRYEAESEEEAIEIHQACEPCISKVVTGAHIEDCFAEIELDGADKHLNG